MGIFDEYPQMCRLCGDTQSKGDQKCEVCGLVVCINCAKFLSKPKRDGIRRPRRDPGGPQSIACTTAPGELWKIVWVHKFQRVFKNA